MQKDCTSLQPLSTTTTTECLGQYGIIWGAGKASFSQIIYELESGGCQANHFRELLHSSSMHRDLPGRLLLNTVLQQRGFQKSQVIFRDHLLQAQEWSILMSKKSSKGGRSPSQISKELLKKSKLKKETYKKWKQGQVTHRNIKTRSCVQGWCQEMSSRS